MQIILQGRRYFIYILICCIITFTAVAQEDSITHADVTRIINYLASDSLKGRGNYTPELHKAAYFIADEFAKDSLLVLPGMSSYFQPFSKYPLSKKDLKKDSSGKFNPAKILLNVVGVIEGRSRGDEAIIFSAHYDHLGGSGDAIFNGANDNASGTTALLSLARYYSMRKDNERTLIFCAFAGEELGLFGSAAFLPLIKPKKITAVINIEMIGRSRYPNSFFITGSQYSDLSMIMKKSLGNQNIRISDEPDPAMNLFLRSDNFTFAQKGIPAHSIIASDDSDDCYHKTCDDVSRIDIASLTDIIRVIPQAVRTIVKGSATPKRIKYYFGNNLYR